MFRIFFERIWCARFGEIEILLLRLAREHFAACQWEARGELWAVVGVCMCGGGGELLRRRVRSTDGLSRCDYKRSSRRRDKLRLKASKPMNKSNIHPPRAIEQKVNLIIIVKKILFFNKKIMYTIICDNVCGKRVKQEAILFTLVNWNK